VRPFKLPNVIAELNLLIKRYELTEAVFFSAAHKDSPGTPRTVLVPRKVDQASSNIWSSHGSRPAWLSAALMSGTDAGNILLGCSPRMRKAGPDSRIAEEGKRTGALTGQSPPFELEVEPGHQRAATPAPSVAGWAFFREVPCPEMGLIPLQPTKITRSP
jgi:hypothetical protein